MKKTKKHMYMFMRVMYKKTTIRYINIKEFKNTWVKAWEENFVGEFHLTRAAWSGYKKAQRSTNKNTDCADVFGRFPSVSHSPLQPEKHTVHNLFPPRKKFQQCHFFPLSPLMASSVLRKVYLEKEV